MSKSPTERHFIFTLIIHFCNHQRRISIIYHPLVFFQIFSLCYPRNLFFCIFCHNPLIGLVFSHGYVCRSISLHKCHLWKPWPDISCFYFLYKSNKFFCLFFYLPWKRIHLYLKALDWPLSFRQIWLLPFQSRLFWEDLKTD